MGGEDHKDPQMPSDEDRRAMREFVNGLRPGRHFRHPIDEPSDFDKAFNSTLDEIFGPESPNSAHSRWVRRLRRLGLIR
jgi:hypothetical protein